MGFRFAVLAALLAASGGAAAANGESGCAGDDQTPRLCDYEATTVGYTKDSDDVRFLDFNLSIRYRLAPLALKDMLGSNTGLYLAFTGRFGQYLGTRDSSPVVEKRFEPKMFVRHWTDAEHNEYWDYAYGHESNGQSIGSPAELARERAEEKQPQFANDRISRGWDFLEVTRKWMPLGKEKKEYSAQLRFRYFLDYGLLQKQAEDYNGWENDPEGKRRNRVNGLSGRFMYEKVPVENEVAIWRSVALTYETGYRDTFQNNTFRFDAGFRLWQVPFNFWYRTGYNSDLAQFYKRVNSKGVELQIGSF